MAWSGWYIIVGAACITMGFARNIDKKYIYLLIANVAATIVFVCTILFLTIETFMAVLVTAILLMLSLGSVPIAYNNIEGNTPTIIKIICACLIGGGVAAIAIVGWVTDVGSNFAVFSFVMGAIYAVLFVVASAMFLEREANQFDTPHVYSAYGKPVYKFESHTEKLKSSISHKVVYDLSNIVLVLYAAGVTLFFT